MFHEMKRNWVQINAFLKQLTIFSYYSLSIIFDTARGSPKDQINNTNNK